MIYRGIEYSVGSSRAIACSTVSTGKYRGATIALGLTQSFLPDSAVALRYRGNHYLAAR